MGEGFSFRPQAKIAFLPMGSKAMFLFWRRERLRADKLLFQRSPCNPSFCSSQFVSVHRLGNICPGGS